MSEPVGDAVLDEVMMLGIELAAVAKPRDPSTFVALLQRFAHAIIREAFEHQDEVRALLAMPRPVAKAMRCMYCMQTVEGPHDCPRMRELGLGTDKLLDDLGDKQRSTGELHANGCPHVPLAEPAPKAEGATRAALSGDDAGAPPAGVSAGAEASQPSPRARHAKLTPQQVGDLRTAFRRTMLENDNVLPTGWIAKQAEAMKLPYPTVYGRVREFEREHLQERKQLAAEHAKKPVPDYVAGNDLPHTETPACWCRRKPHSRDNVWCKLRRVEKPAREHASLREPQRRAERFKVRTMQGTRY